MADESGNFYPPARAQADILDMLPVGFAGIAALCQKYHNVAYKLLHQYGKANPCDGGAAMEKQSSTHEVHIDPVCAMEVSANNADIKSTYRSHTYYFCAEGCKKAFEAAPGKYLEASPKKKKGWWGRHVERLKDVNCDRSMECHK